MGETYAEVKDESLDGFTCPLLYHRAHSWKRKGRLAATFFRGTPPARGIDYRENNGET